MDTKWKKSRIIISFAAFFLGMTLLLSNFFSMLRLLAQADLGAGKDYQETEEFADYISGRLETLISAAAGGEDWDGSDSAYGVSYGYTYESGNESGGFFSDLIQSIFGRSGETAVETMEAESDLAYTEESGEPEEDSRSYRDSYMEELAADRNLLFAVLYQGELLYTNLEGLSAQNAAGAGMAEFSSGLSEEEYNFRLCYNGDGDGRVEIIKDGQPVDVYGDGIYRDDSRWYVPGYTNFQAEGRAADVVVFLAAAREPKLYMENYAQGTIMRGGELYYMNERLMDRRRLAGTEIGVMSAALVLLLLAFYLRDSLKEARGWMGEQLSKIWYEWKILLLCCLPVALLLFGFLTGSFRINDLWVEGRRLALYFWLFYFVFLDRKYNRDRQKSFLRPFLKSLRARDLEKPVQKRLVRRQWLIAGPGLLLLAALLFLFLVLWDIMYWNGVIVLFFMLVICLIPACVCVPVYMRKNRRLAEDIGLLTDRIARVRAGDLTENMEIPKDSDLREAAENLSEIRQGLETALAERTKSERMKVELVTNVSHDLKTPLTSIVSYIELLKQEEELPEHVRDYIRILEDKAGRLGAMIQDVFEVSKAVSGQLPVKPEVLDFGKLLRQTLADMDAQIAGSGILFRVSIPVEPVLIRADGQRIYRVFQNLIQNALQYSLKDSRVYLTLREEEGRARAVLKNTSATELDGKTDFTERFVRGDESRTDGGSGLGLSIAKSFTEACGGCLQIATDADLFTVSVTFPVEGA